MIRDQRGFTLIEMLIVMAIFMVVIMITSRSFEIVLNHAGQQGKSAQSQIEGIVGLEMLRADLEQAGFGLPWAFTEAPASGAYTEVNVGSNEPVEFPSTGDFHSAMDFNNSPLSPPCAILNGSTKFNLDSAGIGAQYLVIKSTVVGLDQAAKKWTTKSYTESASMPPTTWNQDDRDLHADDRVVLIKTTFTDNIPKQQLMVKSGQFSTTFGKYSSMSTPHTQGDVFHIYGIDKPAATPLRMPFNRADYYIKRPANISQTCAPNTGVLYKAVVSQADGSLSPEMPLLDCVADMQVVYGLDTTASGSINFHDSNPPAQGTYADQAESVRSQVKEIKVFILAQEGKRDRTYNYPNKKIRVGDTFGGRDFDLENLIGPNDYKNYRWKVYTIVVRPKNLIQ